VKPLLAALAGVAITSWGSILVRLAAVPAGGAAFHRMAFATAILLPVLAAARAVSPAKPAATPGAMTRRRRAGLIALSAACLALHFATWIASLSYTSIGSSVMLVSTVPVFSVALSALLLGERARLASVAAILVALAGVVVIGSGDLGRGGGSLRGDLLALAGAFFAAAYLLIGRRLRDQTPLLEYLLLIYSGSAVLLLAFCLAGGVSLGPYTAQSYLWLFLMGLGPSCAGHGLLNYAVRHVRAYVVNTVGLVEPLLATGYAFLLLDERPEPLWFGGAALIAVGLFVVLAEERALTARAR